ncbi:hypothetical protein [Abyssalbus ytuae]|uniref:Uncharacterized protein n=1 Tax=Abyssalbus ytuae TaxID=2926907 RepID=A0A9E6ZNW3_9FLAO|nr:hypothetical protein [Abyssalbus ytuae]UOB18169.1 hypothetical protein MQE35_02450 [Abyssalbus ytuae]
MSRVIEKPTRSYKRILTETIVFSVLLALLLYYTSDMAEDNDNRMFTGADTPAHYTETVLQP